jgi:kynurenine formamidase
VAKEAWHRWGEDDERGALNAITADRVREAVALVRTGRVMSLAQPLSAQTPVPGHRGHFMHLMNRDGGDYAAGARRPDGFQFAEDTLVLANHTGTHIDALCHVWYDDELYNGFSCHSIRSTTGAAHCGVDKLGGIVTTGILVDLVRLRGRPLAEGEAVSAADLDECLDADARARLRGAAVLLRTGWFETRGADAASYFRGEPGIDERAAVSLAEAGVAVIGADNYAIEPIPFPAGQVFPVHKRLLRDYGVPLIEGLRLAELAATGATTFMFAAVPLPIAGATASPIAPVVVL